MNIVRIEWLKLKNYRTFWVLILLYAILYLFFNYGLADSFLRFSDLPPDLIKNAYSFPAVWDTMGFYHSLFVVFLSVFAIISISNEYTFRTNRQHVIDGMSRVQFLHAKCSLILGLAIFSTLVYTLGCIVFGATHGAFKPWQHTELIFYTFLLSLNYFSFAGLLALLIRRSGLAIILLLAYFIVESIASSMLNHFVRDLSGNFLPLQCTDELLPFMALKEITKMLGAKPPEMALHWYVLAGIGWITLYYLLARRWMLRKDF